ncbi:hypothetical protein O6H91_02G064900 [Diphasiastrum complanatum]|uniref:Uncharacterized protein n=1 Tax=Diphasiastrum complanatum TaxID=34168 RepID=A0ACC2EG67_DIPCM|nr:hypothetical protein O6H91_02G064900 [Diphasiastrum complanatum]
MPGLFHQRSLSNVTSVSSIPAESYESHTKYSLNSTNVHHTEPPNALESALASSYTSANPSESSEKMKVNDKEPCKDAPRSVRVNAIAYPLQAGHSIGSSGSESDLAAMVHEFIENGSYVCEMHEGSESDSGLPTPSKLCEDLQFCSWLLQVLTSSLTLIEKRVLALLKRVVRSIDEQRDSVCLDEGSECKGGCVRQIVVKHFRSRGYNAAICKARWPNLEKIIGGEYEYIDLLLDRDHSIEEGRIILDLDFRSQFEIARPTQHYLAALNLLPTMFVGFSEKLNHILQIMSEAAQCSLKQNSMHFPPWRTLDYMCAKWFFPCERIIDNLALCVSKGRPSFSRCSGTKQCLELLRRMRIGLLDDSERGLSLACSLSKRTGISPLRTKTSNW